MIKLFKRLGCFGATRFWILQWGHRLFLPCGGFYMQRRWVLDNLPYVYEKNKLKILDVGSTESLLIYELYRRGYETWGIDIRAYQEKLPRGIKFINEDLLDLTLPEDYFDYIANVSVLQSVNIAQYGGKKCSNGERLMLDAMWAILKPNGIALLTAPSERIVDKYVRKGYNYFMIKDLVEGLFEIQEYREIHGHICVALIKK
jgi:SAM-dependent methyltransferase